MKHPLRSSIETELVRQEWEHTDHPACCCHVLGAFGRGLTDAITDDALRDELLLPLAPRLVGTRSTIDVEHRRSLLALDWLVREYLPTWLELVPSLSEHAASLRALPPVDDATALAAGVVVRAARDAAWAAARAAARDAAWAAAWDAAWDAAWAAAWDAAWAAAWDAAGAAALDAARAAARDAAWDAAWDAAVAAAWDAAWDVLAPTVERLQRSAAALFVRMIEVRP